MERLAGRYIGTVVDNVDPKALCRVRVVVPEALADQESGWCRAASPYAGAGIGFAAVPPIGSLVFVEWPGGDLTREPIWTGAAWSDGAGVDGAGPETVVLVTPAGNRIELRDSSGEERIELTSASGATVTMDADGLRLAYGSQSVSLSNASVSVNDGALEVR